jgi:predicted Zn-dependent protease with MMP-like domain
MHLPGRTSRPKAIRGRSACARSNFRPSLPPCGFRSELPLGPTQWRTGEGDSKRAGARGQAEIRPGPRRPPAGTFRPVHVTRERFEQMVADALDDLPEALLEHSENVAVIVEDEPTPDQAAVTGDLVLFGLYEGVMQTDRGLDAPFLPDRITLFRNALAAACVDEGELVEQIRVTLVHEFAHHFGIDDDRLEELGWS